MNDDSTSEVLRCSCHVGTSPLWAKVKNVDPPGAKPLRRSEAVVLEREQMSQGAHGQVPSTCCESLNDAL
jgi:hypothetical protein